MRPYLYILAGLTSAIIGWNIGQFFISDLRLLQQLPEIILFPCIAISLSVGMVLNEIFLSSPTRTKLNLRTAPKPVYIATGLGLIFGLVAGILIQILLVPQLGIPDFIIRTLGWLCVGASVGFAEGYTWRWRSVAAGNKNRFRKRLKTSILAGLLSSLIAAMLFEILRLIIGAGIQSIADFEDPIGFSILGVLLGLAFSLTTSPSYMVALRAGAGFEYRDMDIQPSSNNQAYPHISPSLNFISSSEIDQIEEGLSIELPVNRKIIIGSASGADIHIPNIAECAAEIDLRSRESLLTPREIGIEINGDKIGPHKSIKLKHNNILTLYVSQKLNDIGVNYDDKGFYRFVYYNRFLDPQA